jgi:gliding motility-associated-like protein
MVSLKVNFDTFVRLPMYQNAKKTYRLNQRINMLKLYKFFRFAAALCIAAGFSLTGQHAAAQCSINTSSPEGCVGVLTQFSSNGPGADSIVWDFGGAGTAKTNPSSFSFNSPGSRTVTVTYYTNGSSTCTQSINFNVNARPVADFNLVSGNDTQCFSGNQFCFADISQSSNPITSVEVLYGDFSGSTGVGGDVFCHTYTGTAGGYYSVYFKVTDSKGCSHDITKSNYVMVEPDLAIDFLQQQPPGCKRTDVPFTNLTPLNFQQVKSYTFDWGDGSSYTSNGSFMDSCTWNNPFHSYTDHGCFTVSLTVETHSGCKDVESKANYVCNINPDLTISEVSGRDGQCFPGNNFTFRHNIQSLSFPMGPFVWNFDDPNSGNRNLDRNNFNNASHSFTAPDLYKPTFSGSLGPCNFVAEVNILVKGPGATIENKMIPDIVADTQRHQCNIKDTVYFTNNSVFFLNDRFAYDDTATAAPLGSLAADASTKLYKNNTAFLARVPPVGSFLMDSVETVIDRYRWTDRKTGITEDYLVLASPLRSPLSIPYIVETLSKFNNFFGAVHGERAADHIKMVWDFDDDEAPNCTTWTKYKQDVWDFNKPVYTWYDPSHVDSITGEIGYYKYYRGDDERALEPLQNLFVDTTYEWKNCRYSRDLIPKHWYTPGEEKCYIVRLSMEDTTFMLPGDSIFYDNPRYYNPAAPSPAFGNDTFGQPGGVFSGDFIRFGPADRVPTVIFDYPPLLNSAGDTVYIRDPRCTDLILGYRRDMSKPQEAVDTVWQPARLWPNPNVQSGEICKTENTLVLSLTPPNASGMVYTAEAGVCYGPPPYGITFDWSATLPGCTQQYVWLNYDSTADRKGTPALDQWVPQDAFMLDPQTPWAMATMNMPPWPTTAWNQYNRNSVGDPCGNITVGLRILNGVNPGTNQPCIDEKWYHNMFRYMPISSDFTLTKVVGCNPMEVDLTLDYDVQDSLLAMSYSYQNTLSSSDTGDYWNEVDSVYRNRISPVTGDTVNYIITWKTDAAGNTFKVDSVPFVPGAGGLVGCGSELRLKKTRRLLFPNQGRYYVEVQASSTTGCTSLPGQASYVVIGHWKEASVDKPVVCVGDSVVFTDSALYFRTRPDPSGDLLLRYNFWRSPNADYYPGFPADTARRLPTTKKETVRWDLGEGVGMELQYAPFSYKFRLPGFYNVKAEYTDSLGCMDTVFIPVSVTGVDANFGHDLSIESCKPIITFSDSSVVYDPCFLREGIVCDSVIRYYWDFGDGNSLVTEYTVNGPPNRTPKHQYRDFGDYNVRLVVETKLGCFDTLVKTINLEGPRPRFEFSVDSVGCVPFTVYIRNISIDPSPVAQWIYDFGDGGTATVNSDSTMYHTYTRPGTFPVILRQIDGVPVAGMAECMDTFPKIIMKEVRVLPQNNVDFYADRIEVCKGDPITFTDSSDAIYTEYRWIFGDGTTLDTTAKKVVHSYNNVGIYTVRLLPTYTPLPGDPVCGGSKAIQVFVREVDASFTTDTSDRPRFKFTNTTVNGVNYWWDFSDGNGFVPCPQADPVNCPDAIHDFGDRVGDFTIRLVAQSPEGCYDTAYVEVSNYYQTDIFIPNIFTPNGDGSNDNFEVQIKSWVKYEIEIFNRHGDKVFESNDPNDPWNGRNFNTGNENTPGVYYVIIKYQLRGQPEKTYNGTVTLVR